MTDSPVWTEHGIDRRTLRPPTDMGEYEIRHEEWRAGHFHNAWAEIDSAYTKKGDYIGHPDTAAFLISEGIAPELRTPESTVCSIGFCDLTQTWYGWSHRARCGFAVGDVVAEGDVVCNRQRLPTLDQPTDMTEVVDVQASFENLDDKDLVDPGFVVRTLEDARRLACIFAEQVS